MSDSYLIEIRLFGKAKYEICELIYQISRDYNIHISRPVPHISLVGGFSTNDERQLIKDFNAICEKYNLINYIIKGVDTFTNNGVVYLNVQPSQDLILFRRELRDKIKSYCYLGSFDFREPFIFHSTIAMHLDRNKVKEIERDIKHDKQYSHRMIRATLLKNSKILVEYDFCLRRLLNRGESLDKYILYETFNKLLHKKYETEDSNKNYIKRIFDKILKIFRH